MNPLPTSFADALAAPELAEACRAASDQWCPTRACRVRSGLKVLREVSKEISIVMLAHVHKYTLRLEASKWQDDIKAGTFLQNTQLSKLTVHVAAGRGKLDRHNHSLSPDMSLNCCVLPFVQRTHDTACVLNHH